MGAVRIAIASMALGLSVTAHALAQSAGHSDSVPLQSQQSSPSPAHPQSLPASQDSAPATSPSTISPSAPAASSGPTSPTAPATSSGSTPTDPPRYSATALYNLANSYARAGKPGLAVLNYERAALLAPNDPDITANLDYVRTAAHVPTEPRGRLAQIARVVSPNSAAWLGLCGIVLAGAALLAKKLTPRFRGLRAAAQIVGVAAIALTVANALMIWPHLHEAIVLANQTPALVSPVPMADTAFVLPEAESVIVTAKHEDYILVRTHGGLSGWVARANLGAVVP